MNETLSGAENLVAGLLGVNVQPSNVTGSQSTTVTQTTTTTGGAAPPTAVPGIPMWAWAVGGAAILLAVVLLVKK